MNSTEVREALRKRWPDSDYLVIDEAPDSANRMGRKIDMFVQSLWRSRGFERDAVEIKVSRSDWTRELAEPGKADWWWMHVHRFWLAVPAPHAKIVYPGELPTTWGLIEVSESDSKIIVKAPKNPKPAEFTRGEYIGLMRACANAGVGALQRAEMRGQDRGYQLGVKDGQRTAGEGVSKANYEALLAQVKAFEEASGIKVRDRWEGGERMGRLVAAVSKLNARPAAAVAQIAGAHQSIQRAANVLAALQLELGEALGELVVDA